MTEKINATDSAIELADELGIDIANVAGSGANGRVVKSDVQKYHSLLTNMSLPTDSARVSLRKIGVRVQAFETSPSMPVWVKLIGSSRAILDGSYLLRGEARRVPFHIYEQAKNGRPGDFAVKFDGSGEYLVEVVETMETAVETSDEEE